jgi:hypothetical protein
MTMRLAVALQLAVSEQSANVYSSYSEKTRKVQMNRPKIKFV